MSKAGVAATGAAFSIGTRIVTKQNKVSILKTAAYRRINSLRHMVLKHLNKLADLIRPLSSEVLMKCKSFLIGQNTF